ncbi:MAG: hypothetical protein WCP31_00455 [Chloroflexales bacterium]
MTQRIKVTPEQLRQGSQQLRQASSKLEEIGSRVGNAYNRMDAEAQSAAGLSGRVREAQSRAAALAQEVTGLAIYLAAKAYALEQADRAGFDGMATIWSLPAGQAILKLKKTGLPNRLGLNQVDATRRLGTLFVAQEAQVQPNITYLLPNPKTVLTISNRSNDLLDIIKYVLDHRQATYAFFKDGGRWLNDILETKGFVGGFDKFYDIVFGTRTQQGELFNRLDKGGGSIGLSFLSVGLGVVGDWYEKTYTIGGTSDIDWTKTIGVNVINVGITTVIGGSAFLINSVVQLGGTVGLAVQGAYNKAIATDSNRQILADGVDRTKDALERADLGRVTKAAAEIVYTEEVTARLDTMRNSWDMVNRVAQEPTMATFGAAIMEYQQKQAANSASRFASNAESFMAVPRFVDGVVDLKISADNAMINTGIATANRFLQQLPFDQATKAQIDDKFTQVIKANERQTQAQVQRVNFASRDWTTWFH